MGDGAKEEPAQQTEPKFLAKAGWLKKAPGRLLASYKDRYVHVEKTEVAVYENKDLQNCIERFDLENYDKCLDLKTPFKKRHRMILVRSPKSGNKVHDMKFQAQSAEEKEAWIKAFGDAINRAKNKVFDEVKVDDSSNLEHVTRTRPKANPNRRPPTRIHMREVAEVSSEGILRLDLDLEGAVMPNGTHHSAVDGSHTSKDTTTSSAQSSSGGSTQTPTVENTEDEAQKKPEEIPQKKVIKPPMPPTKEAKVSSVSQDEPAKDGPQKKVLKPPMPPTKEAKPNVSPEEEATEETPSEQVPEVSPEDIKKPDPPPTPPNKPSSHHSTNGSSESPQSRSDPHPPVPPSKEKKPCHQTVEPDQALQSSDQEKKEEEEGEEEASMKETVVEAQDKDEPITGNEVLHVRHDAAESPDTDGDDCEEELQETFSGNNTESSNEAEIPTEPLRKSPSPLAAAKESPDSPENCAASTHSAPQTDSSDPDPSASPAQAEDSTPESDFPSIIVSLGDSLSDSLSLSPLLCRSSAEKKHKSEEKSVDSGQHSDAESEGSGCEDTLAASTAALRGSHVGLDMLDNGEDDIQTSAPPVQTQASNKPPIKPRLFTYSRLEPMAPLSAKAKSASSGDLLSCAEVRTQVNQPRAAVKKSLGAQRDEVTKLEGKVALEIENTSDLLSRVSDPQRGADGEGTPEELLAEAMEKLKKADLVLREVNKLKLKHNSHDRKSW